MGIDFWKFKWVYFPTLYTFLSADLAKIGDAVLIESWKQKVSEIEFQIGGVLTGSAFFIECTYIVYRNLDLKLTISGISLKSISYPNTY